MKLAETGKSDEVGQGDFGRPLFSRKFVGIRRFTVPLHRKKGSFDRRRQRAVYRNPQASNQ
ncbi:MAG: hypothetical protein O7I42_01330 [Alphaproteobacteria bacterium]|nr:hypothetical protein [Alphaproteobacteria bacterium]